MATLKATTAILLQADNPAGDLESADFYMRQYNGMIAADELTIARKHEHLAPLIETYAEDFPRFIEYVRQLRDAVMIHDGMRSPRYIALQALARRLDVRDAQHRRRERVRLAVAWFSENYPKVSVEARHGWIRALERDWNNRRRQWMAAARKQYGGILSMDHQASTIQEFWQSVEDEIQQGDLPSYDEDSDQD